MMAEWLSLGLTCNHHIKTCNKWTKTIKYNPILKICPIIKSIKSLCAIILCKMVTLSLNCHTFWKLQSKRYAASTISSCLIINYFRRVRYWNFLKMCILWLNSSKQIKFRIKLLKIKIARLIKHHIYQGVFCGK